MSIYFCGLSTLIDFAKLPLEHSPLPENLFQENCNLKICGDGGGIAVFGSGRG